MATTTATASIYKKMDFERIQYEGFSYTLSPEVLKIIQGIADQVGSPEYVKTPQFEKRSIPSPSTASNTLLTTNHRQNNNEYNSNKRYDTSTNSNSNNGHHNKKRDKYNYNNKGQEITDDDWEAIRKFQATIIAKKEGIDASIEQIRKHLNKITDKTYETLKVLIIEEINKIIAQETSSATYSKELLVELNGVGDAIFNIASSNGFYSKVYATLYKDLMAQFSFMRGIFETNYKAFNSLFKTIEYCDPNKDYDKFCQVNKDNEKRRSMCSFYINLMLQGIIAPKSILKIILGLQELLLEKIKLIDAKNIVDELAEVLFILITSGIEVFKKGGVDKKDVSSSSSSDEGEEVVGASVVSTYVSGAKWEKIVSNVNYISKLKQNAFPSISNKTIFKHMDIIDEAEL